MNPADMPLTIENLTVLEDQYWFSVKVRNPERKRKLAQAILIYRMAQELKHYKLQEALADGGEPEKKFQDMVKNRR